jgi:hypothetical protein
MKPKEEAMNHDGVDADDLSDDTSMNDSDYDDSDLLASTMQDEVTAQLAAAGLLNFI